jgi:hypothetical protein
MGRGKGEPLLYIGGQRKRTWRQMVACSFIDKKGEESLIASLEKMNSTVLLHGLKAAHSEE